MRISDWSSDVCSSDLEADRRDHGWKKAGSSFRSERRSWMEAKRRRCCKDTAAFKVGFGRTGTQLLRFAPDPQRCCRAFAHLHWLELISSRRAGEEHSRVETFACQSG